MSLLTKEQQTIVKNIRQAESDAFYNPAPSCGNQFMNARVAAIELLSIIDDLQARAPRQYTEQELYTLWLEAPAHETGDSNESWDGALWCARHFGALKAEP